MFCSEVEKLIQQLYCLSEKMELLATPSVDGVKASVAEYQVRDQQPTHADAHQVMDDILGILLRNHSNHSNKWKRERQARIKDEDM